MKPLLTKSNLAVLESLPLNKTLWAFDFDGTLAKIAPVTANAYLSKKTDALMKRLIQLAPVAIVSGRSAKDLRGRLEFQPQFLVGNHGLEGLGESEDKAQRICAIWTKFLAKAHFVQGIEIEFKTYSIAIHYRQSRKRALAKRQILSLIAELSPKPRVIAGKSVFNLLPQVGVDKGTAVRGLMQKNRLKHALYIGDDDTDEDVFKHDRHPGLVTVRVGSKKSSKAHFYLKSQTDINRLLAILIRRSVS